MLLRSEILVIRKDKDEDSMGAMQQEGEARVGAVRREGEARVGAVWQEGEASLGALQRSELPQVLQPGPVACTLALYVCSSRG